MGVILRFFLTFFVFYFLIKFVINLLIGKRWASENKTYRQQQQQQKRNKIQSQEDRIISYQKKKFESSTIEDVEFEEIKEE
jgi:p-aminobenzoyl-glutamate transporter AbgT